MSIKKHFQNRLFLLLKSLFTNAENSKKTFVAFLKFSVRKISENRFREIICLASFGDVMKTSVQTDVDSIGGRRPRSTVDHGLSFSTGRRRPVKKLSGRRRPSQNEIFYWLTTKNVKITSKLYKKKAYHLY